MIKHLCLDLETDSFNVNIAQVKVFALYDMDNDKYYITSNSSEALQIIGNSEFIITFNGKDYDLPILYNRYGVKISYDKHIDLYQIFKKRQSVLTDKPFSNFKLKTIVKELKIDEEGKGEIDYNLFKKNPSEWTETERADIIKYTKQDLLLTSKCWKYLKEKFEPFKEFMRQSDIDNYKFINTSIGAYTYKVISNLCGLKEEYNFDVERKKYIGAYVKTPQKEFVRGKVLYFDFSSLYPMMFVHANLFSHHCECCATEEKWDGGFFKIQGRYCKKKQGRIEELIKRFYLMRKEFKKNGDKREQAVKIIINSLYGITGSPMFVSTYNLNTASDCTSLSQQSIKYGISIFEKNGFNCIYGDTDSIFVEIPENKTEEECIGLSKEISKTLSSYFPFPWDEFNLKLECRIKFITFFRDEGGDFKKKHYIYVTDTGKLVVKGLVLIKKDCSKLSRLIFEKHIKDNIKEKLICKYNKPEVISWIRYELLNNREISAKQFSVKDITDYKNTTSIQSMISEKYGSGEHLMIKNSRIGIGKGVKYCTIEESKSLGINDFDIEIFLRELFPFIKQDLQNNLSLYK